MASLMQPVCFPSDRLLLNPFVIPFLAVIQDYLAFLCSFLQSLSQESKTDFVLDAFQAN